MPIKPKLKHFMWRCLHDWLTTGCAIKRRGIEADDICKRCGVATETREHLFFHCQESIHIWKLAPLNWEGLQYSTDSFEDWWKRLCLAPQDLQLQKRMELTVYLVWYIWKARCMWQFQNQKWDAKELVQNAMNDWAEFEQSVQLGTKKTGNEKKGIADQVDLGNETCSTVIINVAAETQDHTGRIGLGWCFKKEDGGLILAGAEV